ncbi:MAG: NUDIX hydrolase [Acutalibacteraceae bacterium]|nr:NUDIX hydrolase [Acutalibacteraceae bacterium]
MELFEKTLNSKNIFDGRVIHVTLDDIELPNGHTSTREVVGHPGGVCIAALNDKNELYFVRQYRYPYHEVVLELPAGKLEKGSTPLENGIRELKEEVGAIGKDYKFLGELYPSPGYCAEIIYLYFCRIDTLGEDNPDEDEFLKVETIHIDKAVEMVLNNKIKDSKTQTAVLKTAMLLKQGIL